MKLILLPGLDGTGLLFEPLLKALPGWIEPKIIAYPGHEPLDYADLLPLIRCGCPPASEFVVLAESFSGPLALLLAATEPPGLRAIILCASFIQCPMSPPLRWVAASACPIWFRMAPTWPARWALLGRYETDRLKRLFEAAAAAVSPDVIAARIRAMAIVDVSAELRSCRVPLLYLAGEHDRVVGPRSLGPILQVKPGLELVKLPGPHLLLQTFPVEAVREIRKFVTRVLPETKLASGPAAPE